MKIIKHGNQAEGNSTSDKTIHRHFNCRLCGCEFEAKLEECVLLHTPIPPNCYCICPECSAPVWYVGASKLDETASTRTPLEELDK